MGRRWTEAEDKKLKKMTKKYLTAAQIGKRLNRTETSIFNRINKKDLRLSRTPMPNSIKNNYLKMAKFIWNNRIKHRINKNNNNCWIWQGAKDGKGYGQINIMNKKYPVHRIVKEVNLKKEIEENKEVCHKCDTPLCCNPDHLFIGTHSENMKDMIKKGRGKNQFKKGHKWPNNIKPKGEKLSKKLTKKDVIKIRKIYKNTNLGYKKIAKKFSVHSSTIRAIVKRRTWKHINNGAD